MEIYFVTRKKASVRRFNRQSISTHSVLRSNQAAIVCLRPSYRPVTVSLFYWPHHRTVVWIMIKLVQATVPSLHDYRLTNCSSPTTWQMQRCLPPRRPSVRPYARLAVAALSAAPPPVARAVHIYRRSLVRRYQVVSHISAEMQLLSIVRCSHGLALPSVAAT